MPSEHQEPQLTITLAAHALDLLQWLADAVGSTPAQLLADFVADLARSPGSGGSNEREHAFAWFKRRGYAGRYRYHVEAIAWRSDRDAERVAHERADP